MLHYELGTRHIIRPGRMVGNDHRLQFGLDLGVVPCACGGLVPQDTGYQVSAGLPRACVEVWYSCTEDIFG